MSKRRASFLVFMLATFAFAACDDPDPNSDIGMAPACSELDVRLFLPLSITSAPLEVRGTVDTPNGDAIEVLIVAGSAASSDSFDFRTFTVSLDAGDLDALPRVVAIPSATSAFGVGGEAGAASPASAESGGAFGTVPSPNLVGFPLLVMLTAGATCSVAPELHTAELALSAANGAGGSAGNGGLPGSSAAGGTGGATGSSGSTGDGGRAGVGDTSGEAGVANVAGDGA
jgi:hypothetical protein